ncbi:hypothetical protein BSO17_24405 (plasmid) [Rhizobium ruizarguesonis]|nr:hypothetical protein BSO17_24405 [Rhizobium ruizarguesonis]
MLLYWTIGRDILVRQEQEGWGAKVIDRLAWPSVSGNDRPFSPKFEIYARFRRRLARRRICATGCCTIAGHNVRLLDSVRDPTPRNGPGTRGRRSNTAGAGTSLSTKSTVIFLLVKAMQ